MRQRDLVAMTAAEITAMLAGSRKLQLATINRDGTAHLATMFYVLIDERIAFWTYRASQKARNLIRDPRVTCLVETGEEYFELRGVQIAGRARLVDDPEEVLDIGRRTWQACLTLHWRSTWRRLPASGSDSSWNPPGSSPGTTASCYRAARSFLFSAGLRGCGHDVAGAGLVAAGLCATLTTNRS
ncbi:MAG TPA: pyridoxamine 5'-phosphate oxidase family protein [Streptosporangiaceae bacterium]|nr:pyridoxamine 5'-phosphate oxidase family protein [Streptosporangiaceae bacterium]